MPADLSFAMSKALIPCSNCQDMFHNGLREVGRMNGGGETPPAIQSLIGFHDLLGL